MLYIERSVRIKVFGKHSFICCKQISIGRVENILNDEASDLDLISFVGHHEEIAQGLFAPW